MAIQELNYKDCRARIHKTTSVYGGNDSLVLQVCGELSVNGEPFNKFVQSFVLYQQTAMKYYVQTDIFQWIEQSFGESLSTPANNGLASNKSPIKNTLPVEDTIPIEDPHPTENSLPVENIIPVEEILPIEKSFADSFSTVANHGSGINISPVKNTFSSSSIKDNLPKTWANLVSASNPNNLGAQMVISGSEPAPPASIHQLQSLKLENGNEKPKHSVGDAAHKQKGGTINFSIFKIIF